MSNDMTLFEQGTTAISRVFANHQIQNDLSEGVASGYPVLSYRGKVWRVKKSGEERIITNADGEPRASIEVVLLSANPKLSKIYYSKGYEEGDQEAPECFSVDGVNPDVAIQNPQANSCAACPHNVWGSKITQAGAKTKACSDSRRLAVAFSHDLTKNGEKASTCLLRIPAASLATLKDYGEKVLGSKGYPYYSVVTRISFDPDSSFPKFNFRPVRPLTDQEAVGALNLRNSDTAQLIIAKASETEFTPTTDEPEVDTTPTAPLPAAPPRVVSQPVKPAPVSLSQPIQQVQQPPAAPRPRGRPPKAAVAAAPAAPAKSNPSFTDLETAEAPATSSPAPSGGDDLDSMLDSLLDELNN
jgi:hypothetical protein